MNKPLKPNLGNSGKNVTKNSQNQKLIMEKSSNMVNQKGKLYYWGIRWNYLHKIDKETKRILVERI